MPKTSNKPVSKQFEYPGLNQNWWIETSNTSSKDEGIYVASRFLPERISMWKALQSNGWKIISSWIDKTNGNEAEDLGDLWLQNQNQIYDCACLILYAEKEDFPLKGALIEVGMALANGKQVFVVIDFELEDKTLRPVGSWIKHPNVTVVKTLEEVLQQIEFTGVIKYGK